MREMKFRGLRIDGGWVYGSLVELEGVPFIVTIEVPIVHRYFDGVRYTIANDLIEVRPETVGQYIVTENDVEIYEQDIIEEWKHSRLIRTFSAKDIRTFTREYDNGQHDSIWKVIGNIFQDKELLNDIARYGHPRIHEHPELLEKENGQSNPNQ